MLAVSAWAEDIPDFQAVQSDSTQTLYKGLIGNILDTLPMDPMERVDLQRTTAVVSNTFSGRSLSGLVGLSNPLLMIGGLVWGLWAASNIDPAVADTKDTAYQANVDARLEMAESFVALEDNSSSEKDRADKSGAKTNTFALNSISNSGAPEAPRTPVVRIWLPQRSGDPARRGAL